MLAQKKQKQGVVWLTIGFICALFFVGFSTLHAADAKYVPLVGLPGLDEKGATSLPDYVNNVYIMLIVLGSILGVLRIAWAGVKYSLSDVVTEKSDAKHDMTGVLMGLAILLIPFIVLKEINPDLVKLDVFSEARNHKMDLGKSTSNTGATQTTGNLYDQWEPKPGDKFDVCKVDSRPGYKVSCTGCTGPNKRVVVDASTPSGMAKCFTSASTTPE